MEPPVVAIDFDDTLVENEFPGIGAWKPGAREVLENLLKQGIGVVVLTARDNLSDVRFFLQRSGYDIPVTNVKSSNMVVFVDDKAIGFSDDWDQCFEEVLVKYEENRPKGEDEDHMPNPVKMKPDYGTLAQLQALGEREAFQYTPEGLKSRVTVAILNDEISERMYSQSISDPGLYVDALRREAWKKVKPLYDQIKAMRKRAALDLFNIEIIEKAIMALAPVVLAAADIKLAFIYAAIKGWIDSRKRELIQANQGEQGFYEHQDLQYNTVPAGGWGGF